jgi:hypothetical protein
LVHNTFVLVGQERTYSKESEVGVFSLVVLFRFYRMKINLFKIQPSALETEKGEC